MRRQVFAERADRSYDIPFFLSSFWTCMDSSEALQHDGGISGLQAGSTMIA